MSVYPEEKSDEGSPSDCQWFLLFFKIWLSKTPCAQREYGGLNAPFIPERE